MRNRSTKDLTTSQAIRYGREGVAAFINAALSVNENYPYSMSDLLNRYKQDSFLKELGGSVYIADLGQRRLDEAMERVAFETAKDGSVPTMVQFLDGIQQELDDFDFSLFGDTALDIAKNVLEAGEKTGEALADVGGGALDAASAVGKNAGQTVDTLLKNAKFIVPAALGLIGLIAYKRYAE